MKIKRVLYIEQWNEEIRKQLQIIKFDKLKFEKKKILVVYFASETAADDASQRCRHMRNMIIKPFQPKSSEQTSSSSSSSIKPRIKVSLKERHLPVNTAEVEEIHQTIHACLQSMFILICTFDEIERSNHFPEPSMINRPYIQHSTALYMKMTLIKQIQAACSSRLRLQWSTVASQINHLEWHVAYEQSFVQNLELKKKMSLFKHIPFESSITTSSKLAYELTKLSDK